MKHKERRAHPTQKPTALIELIITHYTEPDDLIIDTLGGSGTVNYCAKKLGRKIISIEINPDFCKIAANRLASVSVTDNYRRCYICGALLVGKRVDAEHVLPIVVLP
jgi:DNA modification methylase